VNNPRSWNSPGATPVTVTPHSEIAKHQTAETQNKSQMMTCESGISGIFARGMSARGGTPGATED
jgi:hypothetical protein